MAYMSQVRKNELAPAIKEVLKKYNVKGSISVRHHAILVVTIAEGPFEMSKDYIQVNEHYIEDNYSGEVAKFLIELREAMMKGNHFKSDPMIDYFDVGWYISINFGRWDKPYRQLQLS